MADEPTRENTQPPEDRAVTALRRLARPQPRPFDAPQPPSPEFPLGSGSATGFVGTLAKGGNDDSIGGAGDTITGGTGLRGAEESLAGGTGLRAGADDSSAGSKLDDPGAPRMAPAELIQVARQNSLPRPESPMALGQVAAAAAPAGAVPEPAAPGRKKRTGGALALTFALLGAALLAIGGWAVGALFYMRNVSPMSPRDIHYPLLIWNSDLQTAGAYSQGSVWMAWSMLACVPVGMALGVAGISLSRRRRKA